MIGILLLLQILRIEGGSQNEAAESLGFYLLKSTLSEKELGVGILESWLRNRKLESSYPSLNSLVHGIHHKAALIRRKEKEYEVLRDDSIRLRVSYPEPQYLGLSVESRGIPQSLISSFVYHVTSRLLPYKDFLIGSKNCLRTRRPFQGFLHPELFYTAFTQIEESLETITVKNVLTLIYLSRGMSPVNASLINNIRSKIFPKKLIVHVYGYETTADGELNLRSVADRYTALRSNDIALSVGEDFLYRRSRPSSIEVLNIPSEGDVIFARLNEYDEKVVGVRVSKNYLFSDIFSYRDPDGFVALFDKSGVVVFQPFEEDVMRMIKEPVYSRLLSDPEGRVRVNSIDLLWKKIETTPFIALIVKKHSPVLRPMINEGFLIQSGHPTNFTLEFHDRLDTKLCRHFRSPATTETGSLYLSSLAFKDPIEPPPSSDFMQYLMGNTDRNPGLQKSIRDEVVFLTQITSTWKANAFDSGLNNYIVRRYVATPSGVMYVYPGIRFPNTALNPCLQEWFLKAVDFPEKVILSSPSLDPGGAGYIVTLSQAVIGPKGRISAVMAMDMTLGYVYKILKNTLSFCKEDKGIRCFLFDHEGYVIAHPKLVEFHDDKKGKVYHLTHLEPQIVSDLLNVKDFVKKKICRSREDDATLERRYEFNSSYESSVVVLEKLECHKFDITPVPESNAFLGVINASTNCNRRNTINFCPCNIEGDRCISCGQMNPVECECPCTCPDPCYSRSLYDNIPICKKKPQVLDPIPVDLDYLSDLPECLSTDCQSRTNEEDCLGLLGCSWCREKRVSTFSSPDWIQMTDESYCGTLEECFAGRLGEPSPYQLIDSSSEEFLATGTFDGFRSSPIGPIAGGIMGLFLFLSTSVYCYRHYMGVSSLTSTSTTASDQATNRLFDQSSAKLDEDDEERKNNNVPLSSIEIPANAILSPYKMNPEYRRPPPGTDSDHGYSTMTPFGDVDSDVAAVSIAPSGRIKNFQNHSSITLSSRTSSPSESNSHFNTHASIDTSPLDNCQTVLGANQFIVAATVHMVDTQ